MKRAFTYFLLTLLVFSFAACNTSPAPENNDPVPEDNGMTEPIIGEALKVMSYNVQTGDLASIKERAPKVLATILSFSPDVLGTQEINAYWIEAMEESGFLDTYTMIGEPRDHTQAAPCRATSTAPFSTKRMPTISLTAAPIGFPKRPPRSRVSILATITAL